jgi:hypothetical protein
MPIGVIYIVYRCIRSRSRQPPEGKTDTSAAPPRSILEPQSITRGFGSARMAGTVRLL